MANTGFNYWSPGQFAGPGGYDWGGSHLGGQTQYGEITKEQNLPAAYYRYGRELGVPDDGSAYSRWFRQQFPDVVLGYNAATISDPFLTIDPYLQQQGGYDEWLRRFLNQAPQLRGEDPSRRGAPPVRWIAR